MFNPGKLPIHDLILHAWIGLFGSSLPAMRSLSAAFGTLTILLVYFVAMEILAFDAEDSALSRDAIRTTAALAALVFAVNTIAIKYAREARMYPVMLAATLAQAAFFLRALRRGGLVNYCGAAIFTAIAVGANFSALLVPITEGIWWLYYLARARRRRDTPRGRRAWATAVALAAGGMILAPTLFTSFGKTAAGTGGGIIRWIKPPAFYAPLAFFNKATGSFAFPLLAALAAWGAVSGWRRGAREAVGFSLAWMWGPPILMMIVSYALTPIFVERYALSSFAPFFILVALGIAELDPVSWRAAALAAVVLFSLGHLRTFDRKQHDAQYREAFAAADAALRPGDTVVIAPGYAVEVLHYYMPSNRIDPVLKKGRDTAGATMLILAGQDLSPDSEQRYMKDFPHVVAKFRGVDVLRK